MLCIDCSFAELWPITSYQWQSLQRADLWGEHFLMNLFCRNKNWYTKETWCTDNYKRDSVVRPLNKLQGQQTCWLRELYFSYFSSSINKLQQKVQRFAERLGRCHISRPVQSTHIWLINKWWRHKLLQIVR